MKHTIHGLVYSINQDKAMIQICQKNIVEIKNNMYIIKNTGRSLRTPDQQSEAEHLSKLLKHFRQEYNTIMMRLRYNKAKLRIIQSNINYTKLVY